LGIAYRFSNTLDLADERSCFASSKFLILTPSLTPRMVQEISLKSQTGLFVSDKGGSFEVQEHYYQKPCEGFCFLYGIQAR